MLPWHRLPPTTCLSPPMRDVGIVYQHWSFERFMAGIEWRERGRFKEMPGTWMLVRAYRICWLIVHYWRSRFVSTMKGGGTHENGTGVSLCSPPVIGDPGASITDASTSTNGAIDLSSNTSFSQKFPKRGLSTGRTDINKDECNPKNAPHDSNKHKWQGAHKKFKLYARLRQRQ